LLATDFPVARIVLVAGFSGQAHFTRIIQLTELSSGLDGTKSWP
jgi:hypothetical protein